MTETTAPTLPAPDADALVTWGSWKTHENRAALVYYGQDRKTPDAKGRRVVVGNGPAGWRMLDPETGKLTVWGGYATRFWATPDTDAKSNQIAVADFNDSALQELHKMVYPEKYVAADVAQEAGLRTIKEIAKTAAKPGQVAKDTRRHPCLCGCGSMVKNLYGQGHDARHASAIARRIIAGEDLALLDELPTEALRTKAAAMIKKSVRP